MKVPRHGRRALVDESPARRMRQPYRKPAVLSTFGGHADAFDFYAEMFAWGAQRAERSSSTISCREEALATRGEELGLRGQQGAAPGGMPGAWASAPRRSFWSASTSAPMVSASEP